MGFLMGIFVVHEVKNGCYDTSFVESNADRLAARKGYHNDAEDMALIAAYLDYLMNYEENTSDTRDDSALSRWRSFGLQKGVLRI